MPSSTEPQHLEILDKVGAILDTLEAGEGTVADVALAVNEPVSTTYRLIRSLSQIGWVMNGSRRGLYRLGLQALSAGSAFADSLDIRALLSPILLEIRDTTMLTSYLCLPSGTHGVCIERYAGHGVRLLALTVGGSMPMSTGSAPAAMLAAMPAAEADGIMHALGVTGRARSELRERLDGYRERGYVISDGDATRGVASFGAPVFDHTGKVVAAISAGGLRAEVIGNAGLGQLIVASARRASALLGWKEAHA